MLGAVGPGTGPSRWVNVRINEMETVPLIVAY